MEVFLTCFLGTLVNPALTNERITASTSVLNLRLNATSCTWVGLVRKQNIPELLLQHVLVSEALVAPEYLANCTLTLTIISTSG